MGKEIESDRQNGPFPHPFFVSPSLSVPLPMSLSLSYLPDVTTMVDWA